MAPAHRWRARGIAPLFGTRFGLAAVRCLPVVEKRCFAGEPDLSSSALASFRSAVSNPSSKPAIDLRYEIERLSALALGREQP